jgi:hypothetical protein
MRGTYIRKQDKLKCGGVEVSGCRKKEAHALSVEKILERSREKGLIETRKQRLERLKMTDWKIWKLLGVTWK